MVKTFYIQVLNDKKLPLCYQTLYLGNRELGSTDDDGRIAFYSKTDKFILYMNGLVVYTGKPEALPRVISIRS